MNLLNKLSDPKQRRALYELKDKLEKKEKSKVINSDKDNKSFTKK